jgi:hypothetical protein
MKRDNLARKGCRASGTSCRISTATFMTRGFALLHSIAQPSGGTLRRLINPNQ